MKLRLCANRCYSNRPYFLTFIKIKTWPTGSFLLQNFHSPNAVGRRLYTSFTRCLSWLVWILHPMQWLHEGGVYYVYPPSKGTHGKVMAQAPALFRSPKILMDHPRACRVAARLLDLSCDKESYTPRSQNFLKPSSQKTPIFLWTILSDMTSDPDRPAGSPPNINPLKRLPWVKFWTRRTSTIFFGQLQLFKAACP